MKREFIDSVLKGTRGSIKGERVLLTSGSSFRNPPVLEDTKPTLHIILFEPEIPNNTGNIGRTCLALNSHLHLIGPLGFSIDEKSVRRAGLDYWKTLQTTYYENYLAFLEQFPKECPIYYLTTKATQSYTSIPFSEGVGLMFGPETRGIPKEILEKASARCYKIPMHATTRSLNLANAVAIVGFEGIRQLSPANFA